jgi:hypothetical protein
VWCCSRRDATGCQQPLSVSERRLPPPPPLFRRMSQQTSERVRVARRTRSASRNLYLFILLLPSALSSLYFVLSFFSLLPLVSTLCPSMSFQSFLSFILSPIFVLSFYFYVLFVTASVVWWSEFLVPDPDVRARFPAQPHFMRTSGSITGSTQPREYN